MQRFVLSELKKITYGRRIVWKLVVGGARTRSSRSIYKIFGWFMECQRYLLHPSCSHVVMQLSVHNIVTERRTY